VRRRAVLSAIGLAMAFVGALDPERAGTASSAGTAFATYREEVIADGPHSYWRLGEATGPAAADETGTNPGTYAAGVALGRPSPLTTEPDTSASFDGVDDYALVPDSATLDMTTAVTLEFWARRSAVTSRWEAVVGKPGDGRSRLENYAVWLNTNDSYYAYFGNGSSYVSVRTSAVKDRLWHHVVAIHDGSAIRIYLDGVLKESKPVTLRLTANANPLNIGRASNNTSFFTGQLDEVAIYPTALSPERIAEHFAKGDGAAPAVTLTSPAAGSLSSDLTPTFGGLAGTALGDATTATINVYAGASASGTPVRTLAAGIQPDGSYSVEAAPLADGQWTARAEQTDPAGNVGESAPVTFRIDTAAPTATITSKPADPSASESASFSFSANESATFECSLDGAPAAPCTSPRTYSALAPGAHTFGLQARDTAGNTSAAVGYSWTIDTTPPPAPTMDSATTGESSATFAFSDTEGGATFECRLDAAPFAACTSPKSYSGLPGGPHTFEVRARDAAGNTSASASHAWIGDSTPPPAPTIDSGPASPTSATGASFAFSDAEAGVTFECRLDGASFAACASPQAFSGLSEGSHVFEVRAADAAGNRSTATARSWTIDATAPPAPTIDSVQTSGAGATLAFSDPEAGVSFECRLDGAPFASCTSPQSYASLAEGPHSFEVRARDAALNTSAAAVHAWTVDATPPPAPAIDTGPGALTSATGATFAFSDAEAGVTFECRLDGSPFAPCSSPTSYSALGDGPHQFEVRALDAAGNASAAVGRSWTVDATPPAPPTIDSGPPTFAFSHPDPGVSFECRLDGAPFAACSSPQTPAVAGEGTHDFDVRALDAAGNASAAARRSWAVDATPPPAPEIQSGPAALSASTSATFQFTDAEAGASFECRVDGAAFASCTSPTSYATLGEGPHSFEVRARDGAGNTSPATGYAWTVDSTPPPAPTIDSGPPIFAFSDAEAGVTFECSLDAAPFAPCTSPQTVTGLPDGGHQFEVRARDSAGNTSAPASHNWTIDTTAVPAPTIDSGPPNPSSSAAATFAFSDSEAGVGFECSLDGAPFAACASPHTVTALAEGAHEFVVRAVDGGGTRSPPTSRSWTIDLTPPPAPTILTRPPSATVSTTARFTFSDPEAGATFECRLDGAAYTACTSPHTMTGLAVGDHTFDVRALDEAGNASAPASAQWSIGAALPIPPTIDSGPAHPTTSRSAGFTFSTTESGMTFECRLDGAPFAACTSPKSYTSLPDGGHTFEVKARTSAGLRGEPTPHRWTIDGTAPPAPLLDDSTVGASASFAFADEGTPENPSLGGALPALLPESTGATFYVATGGSDASPGTESQPWRTIQHAFDTLQAGERALVRAGTYTESLRFNRAGTPSAPITVEAAPGEAVVLHPAGGGANTWPVRIDGSWFRLRGFVIENAAGDSSTNVWFEANAHHVELSGNEIRRSQDQGVYAESTTSNLWILGNHVHHNGGDRLPDQHQSHGLYIEGWNHLIANNLVHDHPHGFGIQIYPIAGATIVVHNTVVGSGQSGIIVGGWGGVSDITIRDNVFAYNGQYGIDKDEDCPTGPVLADHNLVWGNEQAPVHLGCATLDTSGGNTLAQPSFVDPAASDYRLLGGSSTPGIDAALPEYALAVDVAGARRPRGPAPDLGAYESGVAFECRLDSAAFASCSSPVAYAGVADGTHTFQVRAIDGTGNAGPVASRTWTVDLTPPPAPTIDSGPAGETNATGAIFTFSNAEAGVSFECSLDGAVFAACTSPQGYSGLAEGAHTFDVRARDAGGQIGPAARRAWTVDTTAPASPSIESGPPTFAFSHPDTGVSLECRLDGAPFAACASPQTPTGLADGSHDFDVRAVDAAGNASPPARRSWTVDTTAPPVPTIESGPPTFAFSDAEAGVTFECRLDGAPFAACTSPQTYTGLPDGGHEFEVRAVDAAGNASATASRVWTVDSTPPSAPTIDSGPSDATAATGATFAFSGEAGASFECSLDGGTFGACASPRTYSGLSEGGHEFEVRAVDTSGNTGAAARRSWTVDTTPPPAPSIDSGPSGLTASAAASFTFSGEFGASFDCRVDGGAFSACTSPQGYGGLADGSHDFDVRARDAAGNTGAAARRTWAVDTSAPSAPTIDSGPSGPTASASASFTFSGESGAALECRLDGAAFAACTSPQAYSGLADGPHTFGVRAVDAAGNASAGASRAWSVDTTPPGAPTIDSRPAAATSSTDASFGFSGEPAATLECSLDAGAFAPCTSPRAYSALAEGAHTFGVRAADALGNVGPAATYGWTIDTTGPPAPTIDSGPAGTSGSTSASFGFSGEASAAFECRLDGAAFAACASPQGYGGLAEGPHTFDVRAVDAAGNTGAATSRAWTVDTTAPPAPTITSAPASPTTSATATFAFSGESGMTLECRLDGAAFAACTSPQVHSGLAEGAHTFEVRARDAGGNVSAPAVHSWTISAPPTSAAPRVRALSSSAAVDATSLTIARPAGVVAGDLLLAVVGHQGGTARGMTPPPGWTPVPNGDYAQGTNARIHAWYLIAGASEPDSYTFTITGGSGQDTSGALFAITGASAAAPINASLGQVNASSSKTATAPSVTTSAANTLLLYCAAVSTGVTFTPPSGMTEQLDLGTTGTYKVTTTIATQELAGAGPTGPRAATTSVSTRGVALTIAIGPQ
jgi:hypothetical protein